MKERELEEFKIGKEIEVEPLKNQLKTRIIEEYVLMNEGNIAGYNRTTMQYYAL
jgi:hypothetical protein